MMQEATFRGAAEVGARDPHARKARRLALAGYLGLGLFMVTVGAWAVAAPISSAVIAPATFVVENSARKVQHPTGGIVSRLNVREGDRVEAGDVLFKLDGTLARTNLQITSRQVDETAVRLARLRSERERLAGPVYPMDPAEPEMAALVASETQIFEARGAARQNVRSQLGKRISQLRSEIAGLGVQHAAKLRESNQINRELENVRSLFARNLAPMARLSPLERDSAVAEGQRGALEAQIAQAQGRIAEIELQIVQLDEDWRSEVTREIRDAESRMAELQERRVAAEDMVRRLDIRAPVSGIVHQLAINTVGAVLNPAEPLLWLVPTGERLHLEARISPADYDLVRLGQEVAIRLHAFNQRMTPELRGTVSRMAPDVSREAQGGPSFYTIRVSLSAEELRRLGSDEIKAGMLADVFMKTGERTAARFLLQPLIDQIARAYRER